jgi:hypothetical protein
VYSCVNHIFSVNSENKNKVCRIFPAYVQILFDPQHFDTLLIGKATHGISTKFESMKILKSLHLFSKKSTDFQKLQKSVGKK